MRKEICWLLAAGCWLLAMGGCKPKQVITEKVVTVTDSSAVVALRVQLEERIKEVKVFKEEVGKLREENVRLESESSSHTITYDTNAPLRPDGSYPKASETIIGNKSKEFKDVKEFEESRAEYRRVIESMERKNGDLDYELKLVKRENSELKAKVSSTTGLKFRVAWWSFVAGLIVGVVVCWKFGEIVRWLRRLRSLRK